MSIKPKPKERTVTVCDKCLRASCCKGVFMCDDARTAGTVEMPISMLRQMKLENSDWWKASPTPETSDFSTQSCGKHVGELLEPGGYVSAIALSMSPENIRGQFEDWWHKEYGVFEPMTRFGEYYVDPVLTGQWSSWKAATMHRNAANIRAGLGDTE